MHSHNKGTAHASCNCRRCRSVPSTIKAEHKRLANRTLRREGKRALRSDGEAPVRAATGYKD